MHEQHPSPRLQAEREAVMRSRHALIAIAAVAVAFAAWPTFINSRVAEVRAAALATPAPVLRDYAQRDRLVAFWEGAVREHHRNDMLSPRQLAAQYLQRYRETGDIEDVVRARDMAQRSLAIMPHNIAATGELAAISLTLHEFRSALREVDTLLDYDPGDTGFLAQRASLLMELGDYARAGATLRRIAKADDHNVAAETVRSRFDELTGRLAEARELLADATAQADSHVDESAQSRAWYHTRAGELAFEAGDIDTALRDEHAALALFPTDNLALKDLAKFELALRDDRDALDAAIAGARVTPFAETLGYESDAQAALGDAAAAASTRNVIFAIEKLGNAYHVNDRLLAIYYADHGLRPLTALAIARREAAVRGDEIYAQDTLAWAAAVAGRWDEARRAAAKAARWGTQDAIIAYHAGVIAQHFGDRRAARDAFGRALALNPRFHPRFADDARRRLAIL